MLVALPNANDLQFLKELIEAGKLTPVVDRTYSLGEVPDAIRCLHDGHARGKIVITVRDADHHSAQERSARTEERAVLPVR
jgi:D-arabinose 1-dehydrogenase-like Zn-dependent alcohol dehydrogenase